MIPKLAIAAVCATLWWTATSVRSQTEGKLVVLDRTGSRGLVYFNHTAHETLLSPDPQSTHKAKPGAACSGCHHTSSARGVPQLWRCVACHRSEGDLKNPRNREFDELFAERAFHDKCIGCHRATNQAAGLMKAPITCRGCHKATTLGR